MLLISLMRETAVVCLKSRCQNTSMDFSRVLSSAACQGKVCRDGFVSLLLFASLEVGLGLRALHRCWPSGFRPPPASAAACTPCPTRVRPRGSLPSPFGLLDRGPGLLLPGSIPARCHLEGGAAPPLRMLCAHRGPLAASPTALPQFPHPLCEGSEAAGRVMYVPRAGSQ